MRRLKLSNAQFVADISAFVDKAGVSIDTVCRKIALDVFRRVVMRTPVDTGRARGAWQTTVGSAASGTPSAQRREAAALRELSSTALAWDPAKASIFLSNNLPYIGVLENGRVGSRGSAQAPSGMVKVTLSEYPNIVDANARGEA